MRRLGVWILCLSTCQVAVAQSSPLSAGPMVGWTTHESTVIWARGKSAGQKLSVRVRPAEPADAPWRELPAVTCDPGRDQTALLKVDGLQPSTAYRYEVRAGELSAGERGFRTLPKPGTGKVRLAFGSCLKVGHFKGQPIFDAIAAAKPDAFLWQGDNVYYDRHDVLDRKRMFARLREARTLPALQALFSGTPNLAQWDDHDYGPNNSDATYSHKTDSRAAFTAYWPNPSAGEDGHGIYTRVSLGPLDLFVLDDRWFRSPNRAPDGPEKAILGTKQRKWLIEGLAASQAPIKAVATGNQFLARYHRFESWNTAKIERDAILGAIKARKIQGVLFLSGDRHLAEANRWDDSHVGYPLWDITSSPLSNRFWPEGAKEPNRDRVYGYGDGNNFGWLEVDAGAKTVTVQLRDEAGKTLWSQSLEGLWPKK